MRYKSEIVKINLRIRIENVLLRLKRKTFDALKIIMKKLKSKIKIFFLN